MSFMSLVGTDSRLIPRWSAYCLECDILARSQWKLHGSNMQHGTPSEENHIARSNESLRCSKCASSSNLCPNRSTLSDHDGLVHSSTVHIFSSSDSGAHSFSPTDDSYGYTLDAESVVRMARQKNDYSMTEPHRLVVPGDGDPQVEAIGQTDGYACLATQWRERSRSI
ncbi:hypothetical protein FOIG_16106 [Fusarium odoratissimum NRRL 54006]|uniref:Uncharacterized protein n=2 Tax=Fusarium oxysporum species complex TaxID=171631 RepID=X0J2Q3_FUSO5|nr:uncharacterized protein FOIG_16106 [Fusarium odoratissimum NRRL 54006]EXL90641.1 hypothetical protein FOIG_16106 [Fusarium odoratissimum NRRL 54006]TXB96858.1 hypothetical protein FocTR4_00012077 [Fusarium oxysporum f. sp. cubense]